MGTMRNSWYENQLGVGLLHGIFPRLFGSIVFYTRVCVGERRLCIGKFFLRESFVVEESEYESSSCLFSTMFVGKEEGFCI